MLKLIKSFYICLYLFKVCLASSNEDIEFKLPDLTVDFLSKNRNAHLEAFKTQYNNEILNNKRETDYFRLTWVSYGYPVIVRNQFESSFSSSITEFTRDDDSGGFEFLKRNNSSKSFDSSKLFHFTPEGFHIFVEMLTKEQQELFVKKVNSKYNIKVKEEQIVRLIPERFSCVLEIFDSNEQKMIKLKGFARNLREYPLKVDFFYSKFDGERKAFEERIKMMRLEDEKGLDDLSFDCEFETTGKKNKKNIFKLTLNQINDLNLLDEIFGPNEVAYLTRNQMNELSSLIFSSLKINEIYEISEHQFKEKFVSNLIELVGESSFKNVDFDSALSFLSKYSIDIQEDLRPDIIKSEMSNILNIKKLGQKSHLIVNESFAEMLNKRSNNNLSINGSVLIGTLDLKPQVNFVKQKESQWQKQTSSLHDQLNELNMYLKNQMEWKFEGEKIVPKSLQVTLLKKANFRKTLTFERIYQLYNDAEFKRQFTLDVKNSISLSETVSNESNIKKCLFEKGMMMIVDSNVLNNYFDIEGKGFNEYIGWHICNGLSNTPDLKGKFLVGLDKTREEYSSVGNAGGNDFVRLTVNQMPSHTHSDSGHNHYLNINTNDAGNHAHNYWDTFWTEGGGWFGFYKKGNLVLSSSNLRTSFAAGSHTHDINGHTHGSHAILSETGGNQEFDNRPSYYVVGYIIYQGFD
jgi:microcystin-dependent protein